MTKKKLTEQELAVLIDQELRQSFGYGDGKLEQLRRRAMYYFMAEPKEELAPPEIEGRSRVVDTTVRNVVLGMEGPLLKTFYGSDNVFEFEATKPANEPQAKLISAYVNHIFRKQNPGYEIASTWIREALTIKKGIIKVWWDDADVETREDFTGQTDVQLALLLDDPEVEIIDQKAYEDEDAAKQQASMLEQAQSQLAQMQQAAMQSQDPQAMQQLQGAMAQFEQMQAQPVPMLYDVSIKRVKKGGKVCIENVPPEEFLISKKAKSVKDTPFVGHRFKNTVSELRGKGYTLPDPLPSDDAGADHSEERTQRLEWLENDSTGDLDQAHIDPEQREVWCIEGYVRVDFDGDGITEWRKVVKCGTAILDNVMVDEPPFVALGSIPMPHQFYGICPADLAIETQKIKTSLKRANLDDMYLRVNGRSYAVEGQVNLDDLLNARPGGVVRVKNNQAVGPLQQGAGDMAGAMALLEYVEGEGEESTGWTRNTQGGNGLQLNQTATQSNIITNRADMRVESISRYMAETGFTDLGLMILRLVTRYQRKAEMIQVGGEWVEVDPREWTDQYALEVNVGLGTGNKDQLVSHLALLGQKQAEGFAIGIVTPENVLKANLRLANALGFKSGDEFFTDPKNMPQQQPAKDPAVVKAELDAQNRAAELQFEREKAQMQMQADLQKAQLLAEAQMRVDQNRQQLEAQQQAQKIQLQAELDERNAQRAFEEMRMKLELEREKLALRRYEVDANNDAKIVAAQATAEIKSASQAAAEEQSAQDVAANGND